MAFLADLRVLYHLVLKPVRGESHADRMESFYGGQAEAYDDFRRRLLQGREELYSRLNVPAGGIWIEMGGGTGSNLEYLGERIHQLGKVIVVDLSQSLLDVAARRAKDRGWSNVEVVAADATAFELEGGADVVTFSYSLTMIPNWFEAIENARRILKPGGKLGVVDFYVSRKFPAAEHQQHNWFTRNFWPVWFSNDNVFPSPDHVPFLMRHFHTDLFSEHRAKVPYIPLVRVPYYNFIGHPKSC